MFYYSVIKSITDIYNIQPLKVVGRVSVYTDEAKQNLLTEIPFNQLGIDLNVSDCPTDTADNFNAFVEQKALDGINTPYVQTKLEQVKLMQDLNLLT